MAASRQSAYPIVADVSFLDGDHDCHAGFLDCPLELGRAKGGGSNALLVAGAGSTSLIGC
jgi:hypothetical protein